MCARNTPKHTCIEHSVLFENGKNLKAYETLSVDGEDFEKIGEAFEKEHPTVSTVQIAMPPLKLMCQRKAC